MAVALAVPGSLLAMAHTSASAAPLPATYSADAHADIIGLGAQVLGQGSLADLKVGHSRSSVDSTGSPIASRATSSNLDGSALLDNVPLTVDSQTATAPPTSDPAPRTLAAVPAAPVASIGAVNGDTSAAWAGSDACVPAVNNLRSLATATTSLAGVSLLDAPAPIGSVLTSQLSTTTTDTYLEDDGVGGSDIVSRASVDVGEVALLGGRVRIDVDNVAVLEARSNGTTGTAGYAQAPVLEVTVDGNPVPVPPDNTPHTIDLPDELDVLVDLTITAFTPVDSSTGATGKATLTSLFRVQLEVLTLPAPAGLTLAEVDLDVAPLSVEATAPSGGVDCGDGGPTPGSLAAANLTSPANGSTTTDTTPVISGAGSPGATVTVREGDKVLCTAIVRNDRTWSCTPTQPLAPGSHTVTATQSQNGTTSPADTTTFTVVGDDNDPDGDGLTNTEEGTIGTDANNPDTDGDGLTDGQEVTGVTIRERFQVCGKKARKSITVTTNPLRKDTDKDGLSDGKEVRGYKIKQKVKTRKKTFVIGRTRSNPTKKDTDRDGLKDKVEVKGTANKRYKKARTDPTKCDTDKGGVSDGREIRAKANPADYRSGPRSPSVRNGRTRG